jgi:hypothetical protein
MSTPKETNMNLRPSFVRYACAMAASAVCAAAGAANLNEGVHDAARDQLKLAYKAERDGCDRLAGNAKEVCVETVKGKEQVAMAHLQHQRSGDAKDLQKLAEARHDARYEVAREVCDDQAGNPKDVCLATAKAELEKAKADVKQTQKTGEARADAVQAKDKADYKVASERCEAMSGNDKDACVASARARFNQ